MKLQKTFHSLLVLTTISIMLAQVCHVIFAVSALTSTEPHDANAMWIEPSLIELDPSSISVGYKFNITAWANASLETKGWQFWMYYPNDYINATRAGYTAGGKSEFLQDITTIAISPSFKVNLNATHNRLDFGEAWLMGPFRAPGSGSLCWVEFEVVGLPPGGLATDVPINIGNAYENMEPPQTYLLYSDNSKRPLDVYNSLVGFVGVEPDYSPPLVTVLSPQNKTYITTSIQLTFTLNESTSWIAYSLDNNANVTVAGNTTILGMSYGSHSIVVYASDNSGNTGVSNTVYFTIVQPTTKPTDLTHDGYTGIDDIIEAGKYFGSYPGHPRWNEEADIDNDEFVSIQDVALIAGDFGTVWP